MVTNLAKNFQLFTASTSVFTAFIPSISNLKGDVFHQTSITRSYGHPIRKTNMFIAAFDAVRVSGVALFAYANGFGLFSSKYLGPTFGVGTTSYFAAWAFLIVIGSSSGTSY